MEKKMARTVLITGATSGFGLSCAHRFAQAGWRLILVGRRVERLQALEQEMAGVEVLAIPLDIRNRQAVEKAVAGLTIEWLNIDVLINNAGLALGLDPAYAAQLDDWETMIDTNVKGLVYVTRAVLPSMVARNAGHIVNIGSIAGHWPYPGGNVYGATKAFVAQFSRNLRADLGGKNIRVTNIEPGLAETEFSIVRFKGDRQRAQQVYQDCQPLTPDDIAEIAFWIVNQPPHVNINLVEVMPTCQTWSNITVYRQSPQS